MKKVVLLAFVAFCFLGCKEQSKAQSEKTAADVTITPAGEKTLTGEFIYVDDAAVLQQNNKVYGVVLNEIAKDLAEEVTAIQKDPYDMVMVTVKGTTKKKEAGTDGWEDILTITEVLSIQDKATMADVKIEEKKN
ncbi:hypothetical protein [Luteirhabdus pelagi]|uniref:hypothetical protein n=1 Tax=Luteirhabdus pelagi TaxID=2792783 RepID=UPI00193A8F6B|nr:hypothetical protein [Luteirhabdus pelagi]